MITKLEHLDRVLNLYKELGSSTKVAQQLCEEEGIKYTETLSRKVRRWRNDSVKKADSKKKEKSEEDIFRMATIKKVKKGKKLYLITAAQNATPIHKQLLQNMEAYASLHGGVIEVIPLRYKNPTSTFVDLKEDWWDQSLSEYLIANRHKLHPNLTVLGDIKIQPTASTPCVGLEGVTGGESSIIGHPRQHLRPTPVLDGQPKKLVASTGVVTVPNYTDSKAGKKGEFHHTLGFIIAEVIDEQEFTIRHVSASRDGSFYDLNYFVDNGAVTKIEDGVAAVVLGDLHVGSHSEMAVGVALRMLEEYKPKNVIFHDVMDGYSISHHTKRDPFQMLELEEKGFNSLQDELNRVVEFVKPFIAYNPIIVRSNHDDFVDRWLRDIDWRKEQNKLKFLELAYKVATGEIKNGVLPYELDKVYKGKIETLNESVSRKVCGVEISQHSHIGNAGSRGSVTQFKRMNSKMVIGHGHRPWKEDGVTMVGTLTKLRIGYNKGLCDWMHSCALIHKNGKVQNIIFNTNKYTNLDKI